MMHPQVESEPEQATQETAKPHSLHRVRPRVLVAQFWRYLPTIPLSAILSPDFWRLAPRAA